MIPPAIHDANYCSAPIRLRAARMICSALYDKGMHLEADYSAYLTAALPKLSKATVKALSKAMANIPHQ